MVLKIYWDRFLDSFLFSFPWEQHLCLALEFIGLYLLVLGSSVQVKFQTKSRISPLCCFFFFILTFHSRSLDFLHSLFILKSVSRSRLFFINLFFIFLWFNLLSRSRFSFINLLSFILFF
jgi:hypothetical protein